MLKVGNFPCLYRLSMSVLNTNKPHSIGHSISVRVACLLLRLRRSRLVRLFFSASVSSYGGLAPSKLGAPAPPTASTVVLAGVLALWTVLFLSLGALGLAIGIGVARPV